jgi:signal transduction histidine kinase
LPPGEYAFHVIACNSDGLWNETGDAVAIVVLPHFFQTWWFKTILALAAGTLVGGGVYLESRRRMRRKLERFAHERELERERARIAQDIHDDLGASLTRIGMLSESAAGEMIDSPQAAENLSQIRATTGELTRAMDEIVWAVNPRHDTLESLTNYISRFAPDFLGTAQIRCRLALPLEVPDLSVRSEVRHNLFLAFKETLHNAVRHSGANEVRVALQFVPGGFKLVVSDNGRGFDPKRVGHNLETNRPAPGNGLRNLRTRLALINGRSEIRSAPGEGTSVVFFVPLPEASGGPRGKT